MAETWLVGTSERREPIPQRNRLHSAGEVAQQTLCELFNAPQFKLLCCTCVANAVLDVRFLQTNPYYVKPRVADHQFGIKHYAGEVSYG